MSFLWSHTTKCVLVLLVMSAAFTSCFCLIHFFFYFRYFLSSTSTEFDFFCFLLWLVLWLILRLQSVHFSSVAQSCPTLCDPMNCNTKTGLPVHHQLPEFTQTHAHQVDDAIQLSHPLLSLSPPAPNTSQHQGLFQFWDLPDS